MSLWWVVFGLTTFGLGLASIFCCLVKPPSISVSPTEGREDTELT